MNPFVCMKRYIIENQLVLARQFVDDDPEKSVECYQVVMEQAPELMTEGDFLTLGFAYEDMDLLDKAEKTYQNLSREFPESYRAHYALGVVYEEMEELRKAELAYLKAIELKADFVEAKFFLAGVYDDLEDEAKAEKYYRLTIELDENHFFGWLNLGSIYEGQGKDDKAEECFKKALSIDEHFMAYFNLGVVATKRKDYELAIVQYEKSIELNGEYGYSYLNLSLVYKAREQYLQGVKVLNRGIEATGNVSYLYYHRACFYVRLGLHDKAMTDVKKALELHPNFRNYMPTDDELAPIHDEIQELLED